MLVFERVILLLPLTR